jgi:hypothetical protein
MILAYQESKKDADIITVRRNGRLIGEFSKSRKEFTPHKPTRLGLFELDSIARFMALGV